MVSRQQRLIKSGLLTIVDKGVVVESADISRKQTTREVTEDAARLRQKAVAQTFPSFATLRAAGAPLILTTSGFEAFKEREKQTLAQPSIVPTSSVLDRAKGIFGTIKGISDVFSTPFGLPIAAARFGGSLGLLAGGLPSQQVAPFLRGVESGIGKTISQGIISPTIPAIGPQQVDPTSAIAGQLTKAIAAEALEKSIKVALPTPGAEPPSGLFGLASSEKLLIGLGIIAVILLGRK